MQASAREQAELKAKIDKTDKILSRKAFGKVNSRNQAALDESLGIERDKDGNITSTAVSRDLDKQDLTLPIKTVDISVPIRDVSGINALSAQTRLDIQKLENQSAVNAQARAERSALAAARYARRNEAQAARYDLNRPEEFFTDADRQMFNEYIDFRDDQQAAMYDDLGLTQGAADGTWVDSVEWFGKAIIDGGYQSAQFLGHAATLSNPFTADYDSLIGQDKLFGVPDTVIGALAYETGEVGSYVIDPLAGVGAVAKSRHIFKMKEQLSYINPNEIRFSQKSVSANKTDPWTDTSYTIDDLTTSMSSDGWVGAPVNVVRMPDGTLTSVDNTRIVAAQNTGTNVQAIIRDFDAPLSQNMKISRGWIKHDTWGDGITSRIKGQGSAFKNANPYGSTTQPYIRY